MSDFWVVIGPIATRGLHQLRLYRFVQPIPGWGELFTHSRSLTSLALDSVTMPLHQYYQLSQSTWTYEFVETLHLKTHEDNGYLERLLFRQIQFPRLRNLTATFLWEDVGAESWLEDLPLFVRLSTRIQDA